VSTTPTPSSVGPNSPRRDPASIAVKTIARAASRCPSVSNGLQRCRGGSSARNRPDCGNARLGQSWRGALPVPFRWPCAICVLLRTRAQHARAPGSGPGDGWQVLRSAGAFSGNARAYEGGPARAPSGHPARRPADASAIARVVRHCLGAASELDRPAAPRRSLVSSELLSPDLSVRDDA
jgi:hypothetical protein